MNASRLSTFLIAKILFFTSAIFAPLHQASADTISLRADEWFPFNGVPGDSKPGFMIEIAQNIFAKAGHSVDYQVMPWERAVAETREGKYDCIVGAYTEDAPDFVFPTESQGMDSSGFFMRSGETMKYSPAALEGKRLGVIGGYSYDEGELDAYIEKNQGTPKVQVSKGNNALEKNIKMLLSNRLDVLIESPAVMDAKLGELGLQEAVKVVDFLSTPIDVYIACSPAKPSSQLYVKLLGDGMAELRASGKLAEIMGKYGLKDWK